jgi:hypothetical protein
MIVSCPCCHEHVDVSVDVTTLLTPSDVDIRFDDSLVDACRQSRQRSARARATSVALRDQARAAVRRAHRIARR